MSAGDPIPESQAERQAAFLGAAARGDWAEALRLARAVAPADSTDAERTTWGARRVIAREALEDSALIPEGEPK